MRRILLFVILPAAALIFYSCSKKEEPKGYVKYEMKTIEQAEGDTTAASKGFAKIKLVYPAITEATNSVILETLNNFVNDRILSALFKEGTYKQPDFFIKNFFKEYMNFGKEVPAAPQFWELERKLNIALSNERIVSFMFFEMSFLGGAHPNTNYFYTVYDLVKGVLLEPKDVFIPGYEQELTTLAENEFRKARNLAKNESLEEAGFSFQGNKFRLNNNFGFTKEGVVFFYNAYEIAPYSFGSTRLIIPYNDLTKLLKKDLLPSGK